MASQGWPLTGSSRAHLQVHFEIIYPQAVSEDDRILLTALRAGHKGMDGWLQQLSRWERQTPEERFAQKKPRRPRSK